MAQVLYQEKAFLQLVAKRILKYTQEAKTRGEKYHDMSGYSPLQCGARVKYHFEEGEKGPFPVVLVKKIVAFNLAELQQIASEILDAPVYLRASHPDDLEYVRETDQPR